MLDFIKRQRAAFYIGIAGLVMTIVAVAVYSSNTQVRGFAVESNPAITVLSVFAIIIEAAILVIPQILPKSKIAKAVVDVCMIVVAIFLGLCAMLFLKLRIYDIAMNYGSDLNAGNETIMNATGQAVGGIILYAITMLVVAVAAFFNIRKPEPLPAAA